MDIVKDQMSNGEQVIISSKVDSKTFIKCRLKSYIMVSIVWLLMNAFFVYLLFVQDIASRYWFVCIPILGFDLLALLAIYNGLSRDWSKIADVGYVLTDKAIYCYNNGPYKNVTKITFEEIIRFEKDKSDNATFYLCSKNKSFKVEFLPNQEVWYAQIAKKVSLNKEIK